MRTNYLFSNHDIFSLLKETPQLKREVSPRRTNGWDDMWTKLNAHSFFRNSFKEHFDENADIDQKVVNQKSNMMIHINKNYPTLRKAIIDQDLTQVIKSVSNVGLEYIVNNILTDDELIELVTNQWDYQIFKNRLYNGNSDAFSLFSFLANKMNAMQFLDLTFSQSPDNNAIAFLTGLLDYDKMFTYPIYCRNNEQEPCNTNFVDYVHNLPFMKEARNNIKQNRKKIYRML